jgi:hypothetical protein
MVTLTPAAVICPTLNTPANNSVIDEPPPTSADIQVWNDYSNIATNNKAPP